MTLEELKRLNNIHRNNVIEVKNLSNVDDRTLIYGYTCERKTFHVYLKNKKIHIVVYDVNYSGVKARPENMREIIPTANRDYVPDKRIYPAASDYEFCELLKEKGIDLPFTGYDERKEEKFFGFTLEDR